MVNKEGYYEELEGIIAACLEERDKHAVLISFDSTSGQVKTYSINAPYDIVQMLVVTAARFVADDTHQEVVN
jgi:hypothetical protein